ncbi:MAG TPA: hypothetical protein VF519_18975 [Mycobacteriales bacterium]|jgi:hypothetical protein
MNRRLRHALATAIVAAGVLAAPQPAQAYPQEQLSDTCFSTYQTFTFDVSWQSYPNARQWAREAMALWEGPRDYDGSAFAVINESVAGSVTVKVHDFTGDDASLLGKAICNSSTSTHSTILISRAILGDEYKVRTTSAHEMGHLIGLGHSGEDQAVEDRRPIMSACGTKPFSSGRMLSSDDEAYLNWVFSTAPYRQLQANYGFEQGTRRWNVSGGVWEVVPTGGAGGPQRIRHRTASASTYLQQRVRVATGYDDHRYRVVFHYKVEDTSYLGTIKGTSTARASTTRRTRPATGTRSASAGSRTASTRARAASRRPATTTTTATAASSGWSRPATSP